MMRLTTRTRITERRAIVITVDAVADASCSSATDGSIAVTITGGVPGYTIEWSGPGGFSSGDEDIAGLAPGDYTLDMNMEWTLGESELEHARAEMVVASRAAGLEAPLDTVWIHIKDLDNLGKSAKRAKQLGFQGKTCIYPPQIEVVNRVFTPTEEEAAFARRVVEAFEKAEREGSSSIQLDGYFIDYPIVYKAQKTLDILRAIEAAG